MEVPIKILYIDADYRVVYTVLFNGSKIQSSLPLETALHKLETEKFDLIFSEPQHIVVLTPQTAADKMEFIINSFSKGPLPLIPSPVTN
jgi:hypothetical protein